MRLAFQSFEQVPVHGKPANLRLRDFLYIEGNARLAWRATLAGRGKGDWAVSHGALPGLQRWVTSALLY
jgi:hypothetical protein